MQHERDAAPLTDRVPEHAIIEPERDFRVGFEGIRWEGYGNARDGRAVWTRQRTASGPDHLSHKNGIAAFIEEGVRDRATASRAAARTPTASASATTRACAASARATTRACAASARATTRACA